MKGRGFYFTSSPLVAGCLAICSSQPVTLAGAGNWRVTSEEVPVGLGGRERRVMKLPCCVTGITCSGAGLSSSLETQNRTASLELDIFSPNLSGLKKTLADLLRVGCPVDDRDFGLFFPGCINSSCTLLELNKPLMSLKKAEKIFVIPIKERKLNPDTL